LDGQEFRSPDRPVRSEWLYRLRHSSRLFNIGCFYSCWADERWTDESWTDERWTDERWTDERWTDERWTDERWTDALVNFY